MILKNNSLSKALISDEIFFKTNNFQKKKNIKRTNRRVSRSTCANIAEHTESANIQNILLINN